MEEDYYVECTSENCGWEGLMSDCIQSEEDIYCPSCDQRAEYAEREPEAGG